MIHLSILTLQEKLFEGEVESLQVPGVDGWLGILPNHVPFITALRGGNITIRKEGKDKRVEIEKGFMEVRPKSEVVILASTHKQ